MGLSWQQGPLGRNPNGQFLVPGMPERVLYAEPLRRRLRAELDGKTVVRSDDAVILFEPGRYPVAYFPLADFAPGALQANDHRTTHQDLGETVWFDVAATGTRAAWQHVGLPEHAKPLEGKVALAWRAMDAFYEEDDRILGHAADPYHRIDIRRSSRHLVVRDGERVLADTTRPLVLYESGFAPRWYVPRGDTRGAGGGGAADVLPLQGHRVLLPRGRGVRTWCGRRTHSVALAARNSRCCCRVRRSKTRCWSRRRSATLIGDTPIDVQGVNVPVTASVGGAAARVGRP